MQSALERVVRHRVAVVLTIAGVADVATGDPADASGARRREAGWAWLGLHFFAR